MAKKRNGQEGTDPSDAENVGPLPRRQRSTPVQKDYTSLPPEIREIVLSQRVRAEKLFWGLAIACFAALIGFDLVVIPFSGVQLTTSTIVAVNSALGGSSGLLGVLVATFSQSIESYN